MCGIIGFIGNDALNGILNGLELLEYRGYDSAGFAIRRAGESQPEIHKCQGRVKDLREISPKTGDYTCGIGHTRWATHGGVSDTNAHPHRVGKVTLVHNGIVENYKELSEEYEVEDQLVSETDTEVVAALLNKFYKGDPNEAIRRTVKKLKGTYALVVMFDDIPDTIYATRNVSPIVVAKNEELTILASDPAALYEYSKEFFVLDEKCILKATKAQVSVVDFNGQEVQPKMQVVDWDAGNTGKQGYAYYMEKEINEQPEALKRILTNYLVDGSIDLGYEGAVDKMLTSFNRVCIVACGTALHAGMMGAHLFRKWLGIPVETEMASEFIYSDTVLDKDTLFIAVSQSGETIDTMEALKKAKTNLKLKVKDIARHTTGFNISRYNLTVIGMQNYYCIATNVYNNLTEVSYALLPTIRIRLRNIAKSVPFESTSSEFQSRTKGIRPKTKIVMIADNPLLPIQGVQHKNPMNFSQDICNFTKQGRNKVHEDVVVVTKEEIRALLENENPADSVEFNDNRISAYIAQQGNCYVMNRRGTPSTLICIHKSDKGDNLDRYSNLAFVEIPIAKAILTESADEAKSLLKGYVLNSQQKKKLNRIRTNYGYQTITGK